MSANVVFGGRATYGHLAGILMLESAIPRIPGDPGHAETFAFPVRYAVVPGFPIEDLVAGRRERLPSVIQAARRLESQGVAFVAADCGLFSVFQREIADALAIPFVGSALSLLPLLSGMLPTHEKIGVIAGDTRLLRPEHFSSAGADPERLVVRGMETCREFEAAVIGGGVRLDVEAMREGVLAAAAELFRSEEPIGAVLFECSHLAPFRGAVQSRFRVPVFDIVSLIAWVAEGYRIQEYRSAFAFRDREFP